MLSCTSRLFPAALHDEPGLQSHLHLLEEEMYHPANFKDLHVLLIEEIQVPRPISRRIRAHLVVLPQRRLKNHRLQVVRTTRRWMSTSKPRTMKMLPWVSSVHFSLRETTSWLG